MNLWPLTATQWETLVVLLCVLALVLIIAPPP